MHQLLLDHSTNFSGTDLNFEHFFSVFAQMLSNKVFKFQGLSSGQGGE